MIDLGFEQNNFSRDLGQCSRCKGVLSRWDYGTDAIGRTLENCPVCGPRLLVIKHDVPRPRKQIKPNPTRCGKCADCREPLFYRGTGGVPVRCRACQRERARLGCLRRQREKKARLGRLSA